MAIRIFPRTAVTLPTGGATLREPYARGLVAAFAPGSGAGTTDLVSGLALSRSGGAPLGVGSVLGTSGATAGLICAANNACAGITCPAWLKLVSPLTLVVRMAFLGAPTANSILFGVIFDTAGTAPFLSYSVGTDATGFLRLAYSDGATFREFNGSAAYRRTPVVGVPLTMAGVFTAAGVTIYFGPDEGFFLSQNANPTYSATSQLVIGHPTGSTCNPNVCVEYGLIYNRRLAPSELHLFRANPYHWLQPAAAAARVAVGPAVSAAVETAQAYVWGPL